MTPHAEKQVSNCERIIDFQTLSLILILLATELSREPEPEIRLRRLAFFLLIRCPPQLRLCITLPEAVILTLFFNPLWVFCFGIRKVLFKKQF